MSFHVVKTSSDSSSPTTRAGSDDFASIKDQDQLVPAVPALPSERIVSSPHEHPSQVLQRLSRHGSTLSPNNANTAHSERRASARRSSQAPAQARQPTPPMDVTPSLAAIRQAAPASPLVPSLVHAPETLVVAENPTLHSSSSLSIVSTELDGPAPAAAPSRWAVTSAAAAAALAKAAHPSPVTSAGLLSAAPTAPAATSLHGDVRTPLFSAEEKHLRVGKAASVTVGSPPARCGLPPSTSEMPTTSTTGRRADGGLTGTATPGPSPSLATFASLLALPLHGTAATTHNYASPTGTTAPAQRSGSHPAPSVPRRKLREAEVSFSVDLLHTAPSAPLAPYSGPPDSPVSTPSCTSEGDGTHSPHSGPAVTASPGANSLSLPTAACVVSPVTAALLSASDTCLRKRHDANEGDGESCSRHAVAGAPVRRDKVPPRPPLCAPARSGAPAQTYVGAASTTSSKGPSVTSATSSLGCFQHSGTHRPVSASVAQAPALPLVSSVAVHASEAAADLRQRHPSPPNARPESNVSPAAKSTTLVPTITTMAGANHTAHTHSTDDGQPNTCATGAHSVSGLSHDSASGHATLKVRDGDSSATVLDNRGSTIGGGVGAAEASQWTASASGLGHSDQAAAMMNRRRFYAPMNFVVVLNLIVTVVVVALLSILPLNEVSMRTINYITSVLGRGLSSSFAASTEANLFFLPLSVRSFVASWMIDQETQFRSWTRHDMPLAMQSMCNLIKKASSNSHLLYVGLYSPYSGYSAYCSPQYFNGSAMYGNYIINNESEPRYLIGPDYTYVEPRVPLNEVYPMTPWEEAVDFGAPNNSWYNVALPWYNGLKDASVSEPEGRVARSRRGPSTTGTTTVSAIAEGWWVKTTGNVSVITYTWPFIDYEGNLAMFTAALQPNGFFNLFAESLGSAALGKAMVLDPVTGMVLVSSWREEPPIRMDNWDWESCEDCHTSNSLYIDELTEPLMKDAIGALGGRIGLFDKPNSVSEWEQSFRHHGKEATVFAQRILFTGQGDTEDSERRTMLHLVLIYAVERSEYSSKVELVRSAILASVVLTLAIIAVMDIALIYLFLRPLRNLAIGLRDAAQLRDGSAIVARRISAIKEVASMQHNFFLMNQQLMQMKAFVPQGVLGPTASAWSGSERGADQGSEFGHDDSFVYFTGPRPIDSREVSSASAAGATAVRITPHDLLDEEPLPFEQDAAARHMESKNAHTSSAAANAAESLRLNERALFEEVNRFRRRYCTVMVACMHICERDLVNQPKLELLISMFMNAAIPVILKDGGVIESQRPDTLIVSFGAHSRMAMHQTRGARCALEIIQRVNEYPALGARVGCMVDVSEYYVGTFGAAQRNARVTYGVRMPTSFELIKLYKSLNTQILLTQKLAASLDRQFLVMPIDSLLFTLDSKSRVLYELRGTTRSLPSNIPEAYVRSVIKAVRYGFNKMVHGEYEGALRYLEPFVQRDEQVYRLALACQSLIQRGVAKPYIRSIGRIKLSEADVLYDVEEQEDVRRATAGSPANVSLSTARTSAALSTEAGGLSSGQGPIFTNQHYLQRSGLSLGAPQGHSPVSQTEAHRGTGATAMPFPSAVSPVDPMLEVAIRRQHNKKALRIITGSAPVDDELANSLDVGVGACTASEGSPHNDGAAGGGEGGGGGALFEMFIDVDDGDGPEVATLASTTHTVTEEAMGPGTSSCHSVGTNAQGLHVQASTAPARRGDDSDDGDGGGGGASNAASPSATAENVGDLPTTLEDYEGNTWFRSADRLGVGAFSVVYRGLSASGNLVALKCFQLLSRNVDYEAVSEEVRLFASLHHENIVQYVSVYISDNFFVEIMELVPGGSLDALLKSFGRIQKRALRRFLRDILRGLQYLHSMNIVHCDIKPHNVLLAMDGQCKLSDFGSAMSRAATSLQHIEDVLELRGTPAYLAPEVARGEVPTMKSDVFSLGVTILELLDGALPWQFTQGGSARHPHAAANSQTQVNVTADVAPLENPLSEVSGDTSSRGTGRLGATTEGGALSPQEQFKKMWQRSLVEAIFTQPMSRGGSGDSRPHSADDSNDSTDSSRDGQTASEHNGDVSGVRTENSESPKRVFPRFQRRGTCAPSTCPLIDDLEGLVGHGNGSTSDCGLENPHTGASLSGSSPTFGTTRGHPAPSTMVPLMASRPSSQSGAAELADSPEGMPSRPCSTERSQGRLALDRIVRNPTQLIRSIAKGDVMPAIPDHLATDDDLVDFLRLCLHPDANQRASADQLLNHSWLM